MRLRSRGIVVAQTLHYVSALSGWSYADLQRQVAAALGRRGNIPFEQVRKHTGGTLREQEFIDAVSRSLREGRFLILIVGDGIREGVQSLTELVNRNASKSFVFGLIEVALYRFGKNRFALQPRVLAETEILTRQVTIMSINGEAHAVSANDDTDQQDVVRARKLRGGKGHLKEWWKPLLNMNFDDPEQEPPFWVATNNIVLNTPFPGIQIKAAALRDRDYVEVFLSGTRQGNLDVIMDLVKRDRRYLLDNLPKGTVIYDPLLGWPIACHSKESLSDADKYVWLKKTLNSFANVLRPRLRKWYEETRP